MRTEHAFVVMARTLEAALDKAAIILHWPKERIAYEILQEPAPGRHGNPPVDCKLRVVPVAPSAEEMTDGGLSDEEDLLRVEPPLPPDELAALPSGAFLALLADACAHALMPHPASPPPPHAPLREIIGDVSLANGYIAHPGDLHIHGHIRKGMTVRASGSITIFGDVETAFIDAGGDVLIHGGLLGTVRSAHGDITCHFAQGAHLDAPTGSIRIDESSLHAELRAGQEITIGTLLLGGTCYGEERVQARAAGSVSGVPTVIISGRNMRLYTELDALRLRAKRHTERLAECKRVRAQFLPAEQSGARLPAPERGLLWQAAVRQTRLSVALRALSAQKAAILGMINAEHGSRVGIEDCAYPGVRILVDDAVLEVRTLTQFATFSKDYETGELRITPLH